MWPVIDEYVKAMYCIADFRTLHIKISNTENLPGMKRYKEKYGKDSEPVDILESDFIYMCIHCYFLVLINFKVNCDFVLWSFSIHSFSVKISIFWVGFGLIYKSGLTVGHNL